MAGTLAAVDAVADAEAVVDNGEKDVGMDCVMLEIVVPYAFKTLGLLDTGGFLTFAVTFGAENGCCLDFCAFSFAFVVGRPCN